ncbi:hypothetical protein D1839_15035 [Roseburia sp. 1XD42-34]|nr:hypothetical protein [Roseburia sp. 1XD42-34]RKI75823.1 hypothetical protein D7V87_14890 [Clostridium sp. 1xD42-85]
MYTNTDMQKSRRLLVLTIKLLNMVEDKRDEVEQRVVVINQICSTLFGQVIKLHEMKLLLL